MVFRRPSAGGPREPGVPSRKIRGTWIPELNGSLRTWYLIYTDWNDQAGTTHRLRVPTRKYWELLGGYLTRGICTASALVDIRTANDQVIRRLLVLAAGASDTTDIPDGATRKRWKEYIEERGYINIYLSAAQNADTAFGFAVIEREATPK